MCGYEDNEDYYPSWSGSYDCPYDNDDDCGGSSSVTNTGGGTCPCDNRADTPASRPTGGGNCPCDNRADTPASRPIGGGNCPCDNITDTPACRPNAPASNCDDREECINNGRPSRPNNNCDEKEDNNNSGSAGGGSTGTGGSTGGGGAGGGTGTTSGNGTTAPIAPTKINVSISSGKLYAGNSYELNITVQPAGASKDVTFSSSVPEVATVDENGVFRACKAGNTVITVCSNVDKTVVNTLNLTVRKCNADEKNDTPATEDPREKVYIHKDGDYFRVSFESGLVWKSIGCDLSLDENRSGYTMWLPEDYNNLFEPEKRYVYDNEREYTVKQLAFLYFLDPLGVEYYVKQYPYSHDKLGVDLLIFKDNIYREIYNENPQYFIENSHGELVYCYPENINSDNRANFFSSAEILFGFHTVVSVADILTGWAKVVVEAIFSKSEFLSYLLNLSAGIEMYQGLFYGGAIDSLSNASNFMNAYLEEQSEYGATEKIRRMFKATKNLLGFVSAAVDFGGVIIDSIKLPNPEDYHIYGKIEAQDYQTNFVIEGTDISMQDILSHCETD